MRLLLLEENDKQVLKLIDFWVDSKLAGESAEDHHHILCLLNFLVGVVFQVQSK